MGKKTKKLVTFYSNKAKSMIKFKKIGFRTNYQQLIIVFDMDVTKPSTPTVSIRLQLPVTEYLIKSVF